MLWANGDIVAGNGCRSISKGTAGKRLFLVLSLGLISLFLVNASAQKSDKPGRKVISTVKPAYSQTLRTLHIEGLVRLKAVVLPNGTVSEVNVVGGNPILVESAVKAVRAWKYAPASTQTDEEVVLNFFDR